MDDWQMDANIKTLYELSVFNKKAFFDTITDDVGVLSKSTLEKYLKKYLESGKIVRIVARIENGNISEQNTKLVAFADRGALT